MKKTENFYRALNNLKDIYDYDEPYGNVIMTGLVGLYEICFEQAWKAIKELLQEEGYPEAQTGSPRQVLKTAYSAGVIHDEQIWLEALQERNNVTHAYNPEVALGIIARTKDGFYEMFQQLRSDMEQRAAE